jgi:hypothetical protein
MNQAKPAGTLKGALKMLLGVTLFALIAPCALAQETTGSIQGTVTDASGAAVSGARVEASSPALVRPLTVTTDAGGTYVFASLPPGTYTLTVSASGFATIKQEGISLQIGKVLSADLQLQVGNVAENVVVTSEAPIVDVTQSKVATNISQEAAEGPQLRLPHRPRSGRAPRNQGRRLPD